jgi:anti-anti-sigma factor
MDLKWPLRIVEERLDGVLVLALAGRLGAASAVSLDAAVDRTVGRGDARLVIDLTAVDYVSSAGLRALASAAESCAQARGALVLCGLAEPVRIALGLGGLIPEVPVETSLDQAVVRVTTASLSRRVEGGTFHLPATFE